MSTFLSLPPISIQPKSPFNDSYATVALPIAKPYRTWILQPPLIDRRNCPAPATPTIVLVDRLLSFSNLIQERRDGPLASVVGSASSLDVRRRLARRSPPVESSGRRRRYCRCEEDDRCPRARCVVQSLVNVCLYYATVTKAARVALRCVRSCSTVALPRGGAEPSRTGTAKQAAMLLKC